MLAHPSQRGDLSDDPSKFGIIQRSVVYLFRQFQEKMYSNVSMKCTFLEIYNEELEDLFAERGKHDLAAFRKPGGSASKQRLDRRCYLMPG